LAGGIGAGKSTVAAILAELGAGVIDSDRLAREELSDPRVADMLRQWWGARVCHADGTVDRERVAEIVFSDPGERARLNGLIHPRVARRRGELLEAMAHDAAVRVVVFDSPLLFETGLNQVCDAVVFVEADRKVRWARVRADRGWSEAEFLRREKSQQLLDKKRERADYIVDSSSGLDTLRFQVERVLSRVLGEDPHEG
jgi:dephospho-CoA kinase